MGDKKKSKKKGGGFMKVVATLGLLVVGGLAAMYFMAPDVLQRGLDLVGLKLPT